MSCPSGIHWNTRQHDGEGSPWTRAMQTAALVVRWRGFTTFRCSTRQEALTLRAMRMRLLVLSTPAEKKQFGSEFGIKWTESGVVDGQRMVDGRQAGCNRKHVVPNGRGKVFASASPLLPFQVPVGCPWRFVSGKHPGWLGAAFTPQSWSFPPLAWDPTAEVRSPMSLWARQPRKWVRKLVQRYLSLRYLVRWCATNLQLPRN
jgi:hypothetical protein